MSIMLPEGIACRGDDGIAIEWACSSHGRTINEYGLLERLTGVSMYYAMILFLMLILPVVSTIGEAMMVPDVDLWLLSAKWFVFWGVGVRLGIAGVRQILRPGFTARDIFEIDDPNAGKIVQELGFWNLSVGTVAVLSPFWPAWVIPAGVAGGLFYGLAGWQHWRNGVRNMKENAAMASDLFMFAILTALIVKLLSWP